MNQNRFKSPVLWTAIAAQILSLLVTIGVIDISTSEAIEGVAVALLNLLTVFGVLNNPTDKANM